MSAFILPTGKTTFFDNNGNPLVGGKVYFYVPSTTTFKTTWQDIDLSITNTNPVILDAAGRATIWGDGSYRQIVKDANDNLIWDKLTSSPSGSDTVDPGNLGCGPLLYAGTSSRVGEGPNDQFVVLQVCDMDMADDDPAPGTNIAFLCGEANTGAVDFEVRSIDDVQLGTWPLEKPDPSTGDMIDLEEGDLLEGVMYYVSWNELQSCFQVMNLFPSVAVDDDSITNAMLAEVPARTVKGRNLGSTGNPLDLTTTELTEMVETMVGDSGSGGLAGKVPAPGAGDAGAGKFLKADATWDVPGGSGPAAPADAEYITASGSLGLSAERILTAAFGTILDTSLGGTIYIKTTQAIQLACSDETTALTTGIKVVFRMPYDFDLFSGAAGVRASLTTEQTSGSTFTVDIYQGGLSIMSTPITIDNGDRTSVGAASPPVIISDLDDDAEIEVLITQIGDGTAAGLKVTMIGTIG